MSRKRVRSEEELGEAVGSDMEVESTEGECYALDGVIEYLTEYTIGHLIQHGWVFADEDDAGPQEFHDELEGLVSAYFVNERDSYEPEASESSESIESDEEEESEVPEEEEKECVADEESGESLEMEEDKEVEEVGQILEKASKTPLPAEVYEEPQPSRGWFARKQ